MTLKNIRLLIVIRVALLALSIFLVCWLLLVEDSKVRSLYALLIPLGLVFELVRFLDRNNRQIRNYLEAIRWDDMGLKMPEDIRNRPLRDLNLTLNLFNKKLEKLRRENMAQAFFTQALTEDALIGLVVVDQENRIYYVNKSLIHLIGAGRIDPMSPAEKALSPVWSKIFDLEAGMKKTIEIGAKGQNRILLFQVSEFVIGRDSYRLFSAQNIKSELELTEIETWKKLIRVLSHEILNSTSPILSLSTTLTDLIHDQEQGQEALIGQLDEGLDVINQRCQGLIKFTNAFSTISKLPEPRKEKIQTKELLKTLGILFKKQMQEKAIGFELTVLPGAELMFADRYQIEQVLINLVKNAIESFREESREKKIRIAATTHNSMFRMEVTDSGRGIPQDKLDQIFLPFYTTKENGSGIGLALSKQILYHHRGTISMESTPEEGSCVILEIPKG
jgi:nitrogen fixation/metabolism regulation signal transduction histidine kinase